ncbi:MAG: (E)-4-hydroxy-3-methylbut-2-enyl-diphosphate synthase [Bacteroidales bacterium]|nr:(E)-4-hydroxy-3-methylbut-2-enyl-diphosphate synthase [Bacteroidales bacterium]
MKTLQVRIGNNLVIGSEHPIVVQTMCNTHTSDIDATVAQCRRMAEAGAQLIRITVPGMPDVEHIREIHGRLRSEGVDTPLVADIHFSSETAIAVASVVEKVRINPGNFHPDHTKAREQFRRLIVECKKHGTAIRIGLNHGSLGKYITDLYGNTPFAMAKAAMEWLEMCIEADFWQVVVSLKSSNTVTMVEAYRQLAAMMQERGVVFPLHVGVTEAGNGDSGRIKSCVGIATLLSEGLGNTVRVSLTEDPVNEIPVARYLSDRYSGNKVESEGDRMLDAACTWGPQLLNRSIDEIPASAGLSEYLVNEIMQAARRRFYKPEYIACPGCGRTMYDLQKAFEEVKSRTSHLKGMVIAVMGCIVNGPGEMADADWGYVGEGNGKVSIYKGKEAVLRHVPQEKAVDELLRLIQQ